MAEENRQRGALLLTLGALGVVFGDIGTSPLYALHAVFSASQNVQPDEAGVYGVISLVFWTITLVVSIKYVTFIMRADNDGDGGIMALIALVQRAPVARLATFVTLGLFGAALFYGDAVITPAISVLSAVEGLDIAAPALSSLVVPIALVILAGLFAIQRFGSGAVGLLFGPVMLVWFAVLAAAGLGKVIERPGILKALSPTYGVNLFVDHPGVAFLALAAVVLAITGAEALYADMGHFGRSPIRRAWFGSSLPALMLNYFGPGRPLLERPDAIRNPFYLLIPHWAPIPMVVLATAATVIASQAVISGAFSLIAPGDPARLPPAPDVRHTSARERRPGLRSGRELALCAGVLGLVVGFGSSRASRRAYGVAVTGTMATTTVLFFVVVGSGCGIGRCGRSWPPPVAFLSVDLALFSATLTKVSHGAWLPLASPLPSSRSSRPGTPDERSSLAIAHSRPAPCTASSTRFARWSRRCTAHRARRSSSPTTPTPRPWPRGPTSSTTASSTRTW